uniref:LigA n=1 Tax=Parastrongyloides trichosuri TaxID=131310 RepID=A0A0N4ZEP1_PARTI
MGVAARDRARLRGAVTGSVGKTSLQQPHRRAADAGADAARHGSRRVRDRHEPPRRDHAAVAVRASACGGDHHGRSGACRELPGRRDRRGARQGRDLRRHRAGRRGGAERRRRPRRHCASGRGKGRGRRAELRPCAWLRRAPAGLRRRQRGRDRHGRAGWTAHRIPPCPVRRALGAEQPVRHPDAAGAGRVAGDGLAGAGGLSAAGGQGADEDGRHPGRRLHPDRRELQRQFAVDEGGLRQPGRQAGWAGRAPCRRAERHAGAGRAQPRPARRPGPCHRCGWAGPGAYGRAADAPAA